jgi:hypothetical protein
MLVEVGPVNIVDANPDAPDDFDEFAVTGDLRIDDLIDTTLSNACPVDTAFASVAGITGWSFEQRKLFPRGPQDIVIVDCDPFQ